MSRHHLRHCQRSCHQHPQVVLDIASELPQGMNSDGEQQSTSRSWAQKRAARKEAKAAKNAQAQLKRPFLTPTLFSRQFFDVVFFTWYGKLVRLVSVEVLLAGQVMRPAHLLPYPHLCPCLQHWQFVCSAGVEEAIGT